MATEDEREELTMGISQRAAVPAAERFGRWALVVTTVVTGLFAGLMWTFAVGVDRAEESLDAASYVAWRPVLIERIDAGIWPVVLLTVFAPIVTLVALRRRRRTASWRWIAATYAVYLLGVVVFTVTLNVPINNTMLAWDPSAPPPVDWADQRDAWDLLNTVRTPIVIATFVGYLVALVRLVQEQVRGAGRRTGAATGSAA